MCGGYSNIAMYIMVAIYIYPLTHTEEGNSFTCTEVLSIKCYPLFIYKYNRDIYLYLIVIECLTLNCSNKNVIYKGAYVVMRGWI